MFKPLRTPTLRSKERDVVGGVYKHGAPDGAQVTAQ